MTQTGLLVENFVFLFVLAFHGATSATFNSRLTLCPSNCSCSLFNTSVQVDCRIILKHAESEQLSEQFDSLLSSNLTYSHLLIRYTPLMHVPRSVCRLTTLTQLDLWQVRLTRLPDNCLTKLTALTSLRVSDNRLEKLQDGLFDGLDKLETLELSIDKIKQLQDGLFDGLRTLEM